MAIVGTAKFFKRSKNRLEDSATMSATTGLGAEDFALDNNRFTYHRSIGSNDTTVETYVITFPDSTTTIDRIFLIDHNFKEFTIKYDLAGVFTDFTTVVGLDGALVGGITETAFSDGTAYYEFVSVTTSRIEITCTKTQVVNAEKFINSIICTEELGTLEGYPNIGKIKHSRNQRAKKMMSGRYLVTKSIDAVALALNFKNYPSSFTADIDLMFTLHDSEDDFLMWLCGGRRGSAYFSHTIRGFRLQDVLPMQTNKDFAPSYSKNVYTNMINLKVSMVEHV